MVVFSAIYNPFVILLMLSNLNQPLRTLPGIGLIREKVLENAGISTVGDLLLYVPYRYIDRSTEVGISHLPLEREVTAVGEIVSMQTIPASVGASS